MPDPQPPIGSATNASGPCSPCAAPPTDCIASIIDLQNSLCSLQGQYAEMLRKYGMLQSKLVTQATSIKQFLDEQTRLRRLISELGTESGCGGLKDAEKMDSIIGCDAGTQKAFIADGCMSLVAKDSKWQTIPRAFGFIKLSSPMTLNIGVNTGLTDYAKYLAMACDLHAVLHSEGFVEGNSATSGTVTWQANAVTIANMILGAGGGKDGWCSNFSPIKLTEDKITIVNIGNITGSPSYTSGFKLIGYLV